MICSYCAFYNLTDSYLLPEDEGSSKNVLEMSGFLPKILNSNMFSPRRPDSRFRIQADSFKKKQSGLLNKLAEGCARKLGTETMLVVLSKMGKEEGEKEYNLKIKLCIGHARRSNDAEYALDRIGEAIELLKQVRYLGFSIEEGTYGPFFKYLVDMEMVEEFHIFKDFIREASPGSLGKLVYYEMLLWIQVGDEEKIHELCNTIDDSGISLSTLQGTPYTVHMLLYSFRTLVFHLLDSQSNLLALKQNIIWLHCVRKTERKIFRSC